MTLQDILNWFEGKTSKNVKIKPLSGIIKTVGDKESILWSAEYSIYSYKDENDDDITSRQVLQVKNKSNEIIWVHSTPIRLNDPIAQQIANKIVELI